MGYHADYAWIQPHNKLLAINSTGGNVGIGTKDPQGALDVAGYSVMQTPAANTATTLLNNVPASSLVIGGPTGDSLVFYRKDNAGKKYELKREGTALT